MRAGRRGGEEGRQEGTGRAGKGQREGGERTKRMKGRAKGGQKEGTGRTRKGQVECGESAKGRKREGKGRVCRRVQGGHGGRYGEDEERAKGGR